MLRDRTTIIVYHAIGSCPIDRDVHNLFVTSQEFRRHMEMLAKRRKVVSLTEALRGRTLKGKPRVALTFDDAYRSVLDVAAPILREFGFPATVFAPTAWLGKSNEWDAPTGCDLAIMSPDELREAESAGLTVESHGHLHIDFAAASGPEAREDLVESARILEEVTGRQPRYFAYPFGRRSVISEREAAAVGMEAAFTIDQVHEGPYAYERVQITPLDGRLIFSIKTSGFYSSVRHSKVFKLGYSSMRSPFRWLLNQRRSLTSDREDRQGPDRGQES